jgi:hypothetical protein
MSDVTVDGVVLTANEVRRRVLAHGMNTVARSYDRELKSALDCYIKENLSEVMSYWSYLQTEVKLQIIQIHEDKIVKALVTQ